MNRFLKIISALIIFTAFSCAANAAQVVPSGECVGVKLYTDGLIVVDTSAVTERDGTVKDIAKGNDIARGDIITAVNGEIASSTDMLIDALRSCAGEISLTIRRGEAEHIVTLAPAYTEDGPRLGLWLRESTAGLGTITFYEGDKFAALGHGICDIDTGDIMPVGRGIIQGCKITSVLKSKNGAPGSISGEIDGELLGVINENNANGLFGTLMTPKKGEAVESAKKSEVRLGGAKILADVDGNGVKEYSIDIKRIFASSDGKDMVIKITDSSLIEKTGGIVQGMSGAPILQNGKLIGAVTHVFVNDALSGYAIFAEKMLSELE